MKAIVTGATAGIGLEICRVLLKRGYIVFGIGRNFDNVPENESFIPVKLDLRRHEELAGEIKKIRIGINLIVNCAGVGYFGLHEELSPEKIHEMASVNIEAPMIITSLVLRELKKNSGRIINISSVTAKKSSPRGAAYGAFKSALTAFSESLFDEVRKYGVKVSVIHPDMTRTDFYDKTDFECEEGEEFALSPEDTAKAVETILEADYNIADITLLPVRHGVRYKNRRK